MAATSTALLALLQSGDEVVCSAAIYGGTLHLLADLFPRYGIKARFVTLDELRDARSCIGDRTKLVWFESPINPTLRCVDIAAIAAACRARGVISIIDNTFASPINQQPIALGVDIVMHSVTKYLNGHSDVTAGALAGPARLMSDIDKARAACSAASSIRRRRMRSAAASRRWRCGWSGTTPTRWRSRAGSRPGSRASSTSTIRGSNRIPITRSRSGRCAGFGGMVCVDVGGGQARAERFFDRLKCSGAPPALAASKASAACRC